VPALLLTAGNLVCGFTAIALVTVPSMAGWGDPRAATAVWCIVLAGVFDAIDGPVARLQGARRVAWGREFDALADLVSFGVAPAVLVGVTFPAAGRSGIMVLGGIYTLAAAWRLARFLNQPTRRGRFTGMPVTAAGLTLSAWWLFQDTVVGVSSGPVTGLVLVGACSVLMVSRITYDRFPEFGVRERRNDVKWAIAVLAVAAIAAAPRLTGLPVALLYLAHGPILGAVRSWRGVRESPDGATAMDGPEGRDG
jgi:CDP-diacylglycerol--serine O-phosphatidyltransferase